MLDPEEARDPVQSRPEEKPSELRPLAQVLHEPDRPDGEDEIRRLVVRDLEDPPQVAAVVRLVAKAQREILRLFIGLAIVALFLGVLASMVWSGRLL